MHPRSKNFLCIPMSTRNNPNYNILDRLVFDHFVLADELFAKALRSLETCRLVNNN